MARDDLLRPALWVVLGAWIGALVFFGIGVAPALLTHAPSPLAGELVRATLAALDWSGVVAGLALAVLGALLARGRVATALPLILVLLCLASQLWVAPAIAAVRPTAAENLGREGLATRFRTLHRVSVSLYAATGLGALALVVVHAKREAEIRARS